MRNVKNASVPTNRADPCDCRGGWFYVNGSSIDVVTAGGDIVRLTKRKIAGALKLMVQPPRRRRR